MQAAVVIVLEGDDQKQLWEVVKWLAIRFQALGDDLLITVPDAEGVTVDGALAISAPAMANGPWGGSNSVN